MIAQVKHRNMWAQVFLMIVTVGFYAIYWFYQTAVELAALAEDHEAAPTLWTILLFVPFGAIYSYYNTMRLLIPAASPVACARKNEERPPGRVSGRPLSFPCHEDAPWAASSFCRSCRRRCFGRPGDAMRSLQRGPPVSLRPAVS